MSWCHFVSKVGLARGVRASSKVAWADNFRKNTVQDFQLAGSAPPYTAGHLVLHTARLKDTDWPSNVSRASPMHDAVCSYGLEGLGVGLSYAPDMQVHDNPEAMHATLYTPAIHYVPFAIDATTLIRFKHWLSQMRCSGGDQNVTHIYVCTHGSRDCRCGEMGSALVEQLEYEIRRRSLSNVSVRRISHVGGHKWAANAIIYPSGDWLGLLRPEDAPAVIDAAIDPAATWWSRWRGRTGLTLLEMRALYSASCLDQTDAAALARAIQRDRRPATALGERVGICFERNDGTIIEVHGFQGETLKDVAKRHGLIDATCGGFCECATCAVDLVGAALPKTVPAPSEEEQDQLDFAVQHGDDRRLACQIPLTTQLGEWTNRGGRVKLYRSHDTQMTFAL